MADQPQAPIPATARIHATSLPTASVTPASPSGSTFAPLAGSASPAFASGETVASRYRVRRFLASGGMGEVYEVEDLDLGVPVALKTIRPEVASRPAALHRFKREVLLARSVTHHNVCRIFDLGRHRDEDREAAFLTMELLDGETLSARLRSRGRLSAEQALPLVRQMAEALEAAHRAGVVHRDFKSANVMLVGGADGERVVVTDFGLAHGLAEAEREASDLGELGMVGTAAYMAPEQVRGDRAGPAADLYALGVVLFEMVTGQLPFRGDSPLETAALRLTRLPPRPRAFAEVEPRFEQAILRLLEREPGRRFERATDVVRAIAGEVAATPAVRHNLPAERDDFVGREDELTELERRLDGGARLVTVLGSGGAGKTRLVRRFAWQHLDAFPGGVWFCALSEARSLAGIATAVARDLDVPLGQGDAVAQLGHAIAGRGPCLVILDNFEQVGEHAAATLGRWVERAAEARFLVTSRERLELAGEELLALEPLPVAGPGVELLLRRARAVRPDFAVTAANRATLTEIVRLVDGLPLGIELAAARLRLLSPAQVLERLKDRFGLLVTARPATARGAEARQSALRTSIDWSWDLLSAGEKAALAQCSVFDGGFTLEAAEAVVDLTPWPAAASVLDVLQALVDKSLLRSWVPRVDEPRFGMYVSIQEYAAEKLGEMAGEGSTEGRHGRYFAGFGTAEAIAALDRHRGVEKRRRLEPELDNLVVACRRAMARGDGATAAAAYRVAWQVLELRGPFAAGVHLGRELAAQASLSPSDRAAVLQTCASAAQLAGLMEEAGSGHEAALAAHRATGDRHGQGVVLELLGSVHRDQGRMEQARACYEDALAIHRAAGDRVCEGTALGQLGRLHADQGRTGEARRCCVEALAIHRQHGNRRAEGAVLGDLGILGRIEGRIDEAQSCYEAALAIAREVGDRRSEGPVLSNLGGLHFEQGRIAQAQECHDAALRIVRDVGDRRLEGIVLGNLGMLHQFQGREEQARTAYTDALAVHREVGNRAFVGLVLGNLAELHQGQGRIAEARRCLEAAVAIAHEVGDRRVEGAFLGSLGALEMAAGRHAEAGQALARGEPLLREVGDPFELGKLLCARGALERRRGDGDRARATLGEAEALAAAVGAGPDSELGRAIARLGEDLGPGG